MADSKKVSIKSDGPASFTYKGHTFVKGRNYEISNPTDLAYFQTCGELSVTAIVPVAVPEPAKPVAPVAKPAPVKPVAKPAAKKAGKPQK